jgi:hypothetical protein
MSTAKTRLNELREQKRALNALWEDAASVCRRIAKTFGGNSASVRAAASVVNAIAIKSLGVSNAIHDLLASGRFTQDADGTYQLVEENS